MPKFLFTIRANIPPRFVNTARMEEALRIALDRANEKALKEFKKTTKTWKKPVVFVTYKSKYQRRIYTKDKLWLLVNAGARPHPISSNKFWVTRRGTIVQGRLNYRKGYLHKSEPRIVDSFRGGYVGNSWGTPEVVQHPGFPPRQWDEEIRGYLEDKLREEVERELLRATGRVQW